MWLPRWLRQYSIFACNVGDLGLIPGSGRSPGEGNGNPHQYSCLENLMDRGAWQAIVHGVTKSHGIVQFITISDWLLPLSNRLLRSLPCLFVACWVFELLRYHVSKMIDKSKIKRG